MIEEFLQDADEVKKAEEERGQDYAIQVSLNKHN